MANMTRRQILLVGGVIVLLTAGFLWSHALNFTQAVSQTSVLHPPAPLQFKYHEDSLSNGSKPKGRPTHKDVSSATWHGPQPKEWNKFLIFECLTTQGLCGGLADREEGLVTVFLLANLTKRRFGIRMDTPCDIRKFLVPSQYDWIVSDEDIKGKQTRHIYAIDKTTFSGEMPTVDFNAKYPEEVVFIHTNRDLLDHIKKNPHYRDVLPPWARQQRPEFFRDVWRMLMKLSPPLQQRLEGFLHTVHYFNRSQPLVGVHVRTGGSKHFSDGDLGDKMSHLGVLWDFVQPYVSNGSDIFVATDNPDVCKSSLARFGSHHHDTQAVLRHIDRQRSDPAICQAFQDAVLDQQILMRCDVLVTSAGSGFSYRAAMVRGINERLFKFGSKAVSPIDMYTMCDPIC